MGLDGCLVNQWRYLWQAAHTRTPPVVMCMHGKQLRGLRKKTQHTDMKVSKSLHEVFVYP